jgi:large subunit ribosomal protein L21
MFAIVDVAGVQHKVSPSQKLFVPRLKQNVGDTVKFDRVLLLADDAGVKVGAPLVKGAAVSAKVLVHTKDETVIVFKKKRRKGYRLRKGHRQQYTQIEITNIGK